MSRSSLPIFNALALSTFLYGGFAKATSQAGAHQLTNPRQLLISTNKKLFWLNLDSGEERILHEGRGVYYGVFGGELGVNDTPSVWVMVRSDKRLNSSGPECLLRLPSNEFPAVVMEEVCVPSKMAHDAVRTNESVLIASTLTGAIVELSYPDMQLRKVHQRFLRNDHLNTLSPMPLNQVWSLLHSRGKPSRLVLIELGVESNTPLTEIVGFGRGAHGIVQLGLEFENDLLVLSSDEGRLVRVPTQGAKANLVWQEPNRRFLKGLCVIAGIAYVGVNGLSRQPASAPRSTREQTSWRARNDTDIVAINISSRELLWRRNVPSVNGVLNVLSAPHLSFDSTYIAIPSWSTINDSELDRGEFRASPSNDYKDLEL